MSIATVPFMPRRIADFGRPLQMPLLTALAYYLGAEAAFFVGTLSDKIFAPFWPPNVVMFCALLLAPTRRWWLYFLFTFPAHIVAELSVGMGTPQILIAFAGNCLVAALDAAAVRILLGNPPWFNTLQKAGIYILATTIACPMMAALVGAFDRVTTAGSMEHYWAYWSQWYLANAVGSVALGPIALILLRGRFVRIASLNRHRVIEGVVLAVLLTVVCAIAFKASASTISSNFLPALMYSPLPLVLWAAVRFGVRGASGATLLVAVVLIWCALNGPSLFLSGSPETSVLAIQAFLLGLAIPILLLGVSIDETRYADQAVRASEERMISAAISADVCLWHVDYQSDRVWMTNYGREMLGFDPHQPITRGLMLNAIHPDDRAAAVESLRAAAAANTLADCEFRIVKPDGQTCWVRCRARAHSDYRGAPAQITGTFANISDRKASESELAHQRQEIAHRMRVSMVGELSGGIAHELTQPLTAILSNAEAAKVLVTRDSPDLAEVTDMLTDIIEEDHRAGEVIHRLRGLLKNSDAKFEAVNLSDIIVATQRLLHHEFVTKSIKISTDLAPNLPLVSGDAVQLQQMLLNLLLNAIDAVSEVPTSRRVLAIAAKMVGDRVQVEIADRGSGLAEADPDRIFQPFFTTKERGLGLGLSLCSAIVKQHGGTLGLHNNPTWGATATFTLPVLAVQRAAE